MLYAVISDVHANLEAVESCFKKIDEIKPDRIICLGDIVDYCAQPNEVTGIIRARCDIVVLGNHDEAQFNFPLSEGFSERARISSVHTRDVINPEHVDYFKTLPYTHSENNLLFVHSSPADPKKYAYILNEEKAQLNFSCFGERVCFIGHSHIPIIFEQHSGKISIVNSIKADEDKKYIINVGSVGQPRDNNPRLSFGIFDSEKIEYFNLRIDYDIESASKKILNEGLPVYLAERLLTGV